MLTRLLIAVNVIAYLWEQLTGFDAVELRYGLVAQPVFAGEWWRLFTSAFLHASLMHIAFNMFALYQVGTWVERFYGEYYFRTKVIWRMVRKVIFNPHDRRRLAKEAREYMALRARRRKFISDQRQQTAVSANAGD